MFLWPLLCCCLCRLRFARSFILPSFLAALPRFWFDFSHSSGVFALSCGQHQHLSFSLSQLLCLSAFRENIYKIVIKSVIKSEINATEPEPYDEFRFISQSARNTRKKCRRAKKVSQGCVVTQTIKGLCVWSKIEKQTSKIQSMLFKVDFLNTILIAKQTVNTQKENLLKVNLYPWKK